MNALKYIPLEVGLPALNNSVLFYEDRQINDLERHLKFRYFKPLSLLLLFTNCRWEEGKNLFYFSFDSSFYFKDLIRVTLILAMEENVNKRPTASNVHAPLEK